MKIKFEQFIYQCHSWSMVCWQLSRALLKTQHDIHLIPTDKKYTNHTPNDLLPYIKSQVDKDFYCQISYTAPINWPKYLNSGGNKNRFAIWAYEFNGKNALPLGSAKYHQYVDKILPPSNFCKDIFINGGIPEEKIIVLPHGINLSDYENKNKYPLKTNKKLKFGLALGQLHKRKNLTGLLKAYYNAFTKNDDVCLVLKIQTQKAQEKQGLHSFDDDFYKIYNNLNRLYPNRPEVEIIEEFIPNMIEFHNAIDILFTMTNCEGFCLPALDHAALGKLVIAPRYGGQLDFLNDNNSLLKHGNICRAPRDYFYWSSNPFGEMFNPSIDHAVELLKKAYTEHNDLVAKFNTNLIQIAQKFTWDEAAKQLISLCN